MHIMPWALALALFKAGNSIAAKIAIMAMTTSNSISVNDRAERLSLRVVFLVCTDLAYFAGVLVPRYLSRNAISSLMASLNRKTEWPLS